MRREYFDSEWRVTLMAQPKWAKDANAQQKELWWSKFSHLTDSQFKQLCDLLVDNYKYMPSIGEAKKHAHDIARPIIANKEPIEAYTIHARILACEDYTWLSEIYTGRRWPAGITAENIADMCNMLDRCHNVKDRNVDIVPCFMITTYRSAMLRHGFTPYGIDAAQQEMISAYGDETAEKFIQTAKQLMPNIENETDIPPQDDQYIPASKPSLEVIEEEPYYVKN